MIPKLRSEKLSQVITATREPIFRGTSIQKICACAGEPTLAIEQLFPNSLWVYYYNLIPWMVYCDLMCDQNFLELTKLFPEDTASQPWLVQL